MSSHHFVKEGQEPDLLILSGDERLQTPLEQLLGWCPRVLVTDDILEKVLSKGLKVDEVWTLDGASTIVEELMQYQWPYQIREVNELGWTVIANHISDLRPLALRVLHLSAQVSEDEIFDQVAALPGLSECSFYSEIGHLYPIPQKGLSKFFAEGTEIQLFGQGVQVKGPMSQADANEIEWVQKENGVTTILPGKGTCWIREKQVW